MEPHQEESMNSLGADRLALLTLPWFPFSEFVVPGEDWYTGRQKP